MSRTTACPGASRSASTGNPSAPGVARARRVLATLLESADVRFDGNRPWDIQVHDERFFPRVLAQGSLAVGESYMDGWWSCPRLDEMIFRVLRRGNPFQLGRGRLLWESLRARLFNPQSPRRAHVVGERHYDLGNDLFTEMLDPELIYSCAYWKNTDNLAEAQLAKLDLLCRKLRLKPGQRLLDIGCGWGGLLRYAARHYGVSGVGLTVSHEQSEEARRRTPKDLPVEFRLEDYRRHHETYDRIVSVGMFEHVGERNYRTFFEACRNMLRCDDDLLALHTIGDIETTSHSDPWITRHIFPNSQLPSAEHIARAADRRFIIEDWQNFGPDYDRTLMAWHANFQNAWPRLQSRYDERFRRMWEYYLLACAGAFRAREIQLWQIVLSPRGQAAARYDAPR